MKSILLDKDQIPSVVFPMEEVLETEQEKSDRMLNLEKALKLGNLYKGKSRIFFLSQLRESFAVEATVWSIGDRYISLKGGRTIPLNAIVKVEN